MTCLRRLPDKPVYTTGEVAFAIAVSPTTVCRMIASGEVKHFVIPGSRHRRVPRAELERLAREFQSPLSLYLTAPG